MTEKKRLKEMVAYLSESMGDHGACIVLATILDSLNRYVGDAEEKRVSTMSVKWDGGYEMTVDFAKAEYINQFK